MIFAAIICGLVAAILAAKLFETYNGPHPSRPPVRNPACPFHGYQHEGVNTNHAVQYGEARPYMQCQLCGRRWPVDDWSLDTVTLPDGRTANHPPRNP